MSIYKPLLAKQPKAKPLAQTLVKAAAEQGASYEDLDLACKLACEAYRRALDRSCVALSEFESESQATLESI